MRQQFLQYINFMAISGQLTADTSLLSRSRPDAGDAQGPDRLARVRAALLQWGAARATRCALASVSASVSTPGTNALHTPRTARACALSARPSQRTVPPRPSSLASASCSITRPQSRLSCADSSVAPRPVWAQAKPADLGKKLAKAKKRAANATALLVEDPSDGEARQLRDEDRAEVKRIEAQLVDVAAPVTLPNPEAIAGGLRRLLDLFADSPRWATPRSCGAT